MKFLRRLLAAAAVICLILTVLPAASAETDERFENKDWEQVVQDFLAAYNIPDYAKYAVGYYNTVTGEEHYLNPDLYISVGSVYKVPLNMLFCEKIAKGEMTLDSLISGYTYEVLLRGTIIDSNNDYARILWNYNGSYHHYRELIAPYMGEDAATVDATFYKNNLFTARQMIFCLKLLYENPDRFPHLLETLAEAEPRNYFRRDENRWPIAHKYGYDYGNDPYYYEDVADFGIFQTTDTFLLAFSSENVPQAFDLEAKLATLMCDYTEYNTSKRLRAGAADRAVETLTLPAAPEAVAGGTAAQAENAPVFDMDLGTFIKLIAVISVMVIGLGLCEKLARRAGYITLLPVLVLLVGGFLIGRSLINSAGGSFFTVVKGDGEETVSSFFTALEQRDYEAALALTSGYSAFGVESAPADDMTARLYEALRGSYSHTLGAGGVEDKEATRTVTLRHLSIPLLQEGLKAETKTVLERFEAEREASLVFDEGYVFKPEVVDEACSVAFSTVMSRVTDYYTDDTLDLSLVYGFRGWMIQPNAALMNAICGR